MPIDPLEISARLQNLGEVFVVPKPKFNPDRLDHYDGFRNSSSKAKDYFIERMREGPSRKVGTHTRGNVCVQNPTHSMGHSTNAESHTQELSFDIRADADTYILAHYDQPPAIEVIAHDKNGRRQRRVHTPDRVILLPDSICVVEIKPYYKIVELCNKYPLDWKLDSGCARFLPAESAFYDIGIAHIVWYPPKDGATFTRNLDLLHQLSRNYKDNEHPKSKAILKELIRVRCASMAQLNKACDSNDITPILCLIRSHKVVATMSTHILTDINSSLVAVSDADLAAISDVREQIVGEGLPVSSVGGPGLATTLEQQEGLRRLAIANSGEKSRSARRYRKAIYDGSKKGLTALQALLPNRKARTQGDGRKAPKRHKIVLDYLNNYIEGNIERTDNNNFYVDDSRRLTDSGAYAEYMTDAKTAHPDLAPVSRQTFVKYLHSKDAVRRANIRGGVRAANAAQPPTDVETRTSEPTRPFERATIDHYKADIFCEALHDTYGQYIASPWVSVMLDLSTRFVLALWITFRHPSRATCASLLRLCARIHGRWPEGIVVDRGSDFQSVYFQSVLADQAVRKYDRPVSDPRFGGEAERFFQELRHQCLNHLPGNYVVSKDNRAVSSSHHAKNAKKLLDLREFIDQAGQYVAWRNGYSLGSSQSAPAILMQEKLNLFPHSGRDTTVNESFMVATAVDDGMYKLDRQRGLHIPPYHYSNPLLFHAKSDSIEVRKDPENPYLVYAHVNNAWIPCYASPNSHFITASDSERRFIIARESVPHSIKDSQSKSATVERISGIRKTLESSHNAHLTQIPHAQALSDIDEGETAANIFDKARTSTTEALEYES